MISSKSILAKLLATENIRIEHKKVQTAYFDLKNRVMVLPIWKTTTPHLYDLLLGHEVGHALNTPSEGWHDCVTEKHKKGFKSFLNVIEDARIEKLMQVKFPGLKVSFKKGYSNLMEMDFFGVQKNNWDIDRLPLIDRINLHYKVGSYLNIQFSDYEKPFLAKIDEVKTWDDVVAIANELYEYSKTEPKLPQMDDIEFDSKFDEDEDDDDDTEYEERDSEDEDPSKRGRQSDSGRTLDPESLTDKYFRGIENTLVDASVKPYVYANLPDINLNNIIVPYKKIFEYTNDFKFRYDSRVVNSSEEEKEQIISNLKDKLYQRFLNTNKKYISYLVKEFELQRNARQFARAAVSKTGKLDMKKVHQYKLNDDIFKRISVIPKGKSHGLILFVDYSGSMTENIGATIEQTIILAMFCRKVNIPFRVYAFLDAGGENFLKEHNIDISTEEYYRRLHGSKLIDKFSSNEDDYVFDGMYFRLREYLSSEMSGNEFKDMIKFWLTAGYAHGLRNYRSRWQDPSLGEESDKIMNGDFEVLNGTPLNEAVACSIKITKEFKEKYKLDLVNTVFLTDGDSNDSESKFAAEGRINYLSKYGNDYNLVFRDPKTMLEGIKPPGAETTVGLLNLLKSMTGINVIGFFISPFYGRGVVINRLRKFGKFDTDFEIKYKNSKQTKFYMINNVGYDDYYIIPGGKDLQVTEDVLKVEENATKSAIKNAFMKMQKGKFVNRVLLNRFISKIA